MLFSVPTPNFKFLAILIMPDGQDMEKSTKEKVKSACKLLQLNTLVEAGGIEPPSERCQSKASTCLFSDLNLTRVISQRQDLIQASS